jgi:DNA-binding beta-propeller fold protein YncE
VLVFDQAGNLVRHWGGPGAGYEWPESNHGIFVDHKSNVWIGGNGAKDAHLLKFTKDGKFLMQVGHLGKSGGSNDLENFGRVAKIFVDAKTNEAYVADGYGNRRVAVIDADTGKIKRYWGAYGNKPDDTNLGPYDPKAPVAQQFRNPVHCADVSHDGLVYVCDRMNNRIQVFEKDGRFVRQFVQETATRGSGSVWDLVPSEDPAQRYLLVADGTNNEVRITERASGEVLGSFGRPGRQAGDFHWVHNIAVDSQGSVYTSEVDTGKRAQRFVRVR